MADVNPIVVISGVSKELEPTDRLKLSGGIPIDIPVAADDLKSPRYDHAAGEINWVTISGGGTGTSKHSELSELDYASALHTGFEPTKGLDDNYVTDAEKIILSNTSGTNSGNVTITDTNSIDLGLSGQALTADLKYQDSTTVDLSVDAGGLKATVIASGIDHDSLTGIHGGAVGEYNHITDAEKAAIGTSTAYSGVAPITISGTVISHAISGATAGTYGQTTVDVLGHVTSGGIDVIAAQRSWFL